MAPDSRCHEPSVASRRMRSRSSDNGRFSPSGSKRSNSSEVASKISWLLTFSVRDLLQGLQLSLDSAQGNDELLAQLECAQENADAAMGNVMQAIEPVSALLSLMSPLFEIAQMPPLTLSVEGGSASAEGLTTADVCARVDALSRRLVEAIAAGRCGRLSEAEILNPIDNAPRARFVAFRHPEAQAWKKTLMEHDVITDVRDDVLRVGLGLYHDDEDIERFCEAASRLLA